MLKNVIEEVRTRYSYPVAVFLAGKEDVTNKLSRQLLRFTFGESI